MRWLFFESSSRTKETVVLRCFTRLDASAEEYVIGTISDVAVYGGNFDRYGLMHLRDDESFTSEEQTPELLRDPRTFLVRKIRGTAIYRMDIDKMDDTELAFVREVIARAKVTCYGNPAPLLLRVIDEETEKRNRYPKEGVRF